MRRLLCSRRRKLEAAKTTSTSAQRRLNYPATSEFGIRVPQNGLPLLMVTNWLPSTLVTYSHDVLSS